MRNVKELFDKRKQAIKAMRDITDKALAENNRDLTSEENASWDRAWAEQQSIQAQLERIEKEDELSRQIADEKFGQIDPQNIQTPEQKKENEIKSVLQSFCKGDQIERGLSPEVYNSLKVSPDSGGGYLVPPVTWVNRLIKTVDDMTFIRQFATVIPITKSQSLGAPSLDNDPGDADWTTEIATGNEDSTMSFGAREMKPNPVAKLLKVSRDLLRIAAQPVEQIVADRLAYKFAITQEKAFLTGSGASRPLGLFTASAAGISTGRDVSTDNTTTAITFDGLKNAKYSMKGNYWPSLRWLFHRDAIKMIAKLTDDQSRYLWQDSVKDGEPDRLLGFPVHMSEYVPNTFTTGLYVGLLGDFSKYWIVDSLDFQLDRLVERYAETNQIGFIGRMSTDAMPVLEEAFARVTLG